MNKNNGDWIQKSICEYDDLMWKFIDKTKRYNPEIGGLLYEEEKFMQIDMKQLIYEYADRIINTNDDYGIQSYEYDDEKIVLIQPNLVGMACRLSLEVLGRDIFDEYQKESHRVFSENKDLRKYKCDDLFRVVRETGFFVMRNVDNERFSEFFINKLRRLVGEKINELELGELVGNWYNHNSWNSYLPDTYLTYILPSKQTVETHFKECLTYDINEFKFKMKNRGMIFNDTELKKSIDESNLITNYGFDYEYKRTQLLDYMILTIKNNINNFEATDLERILSKHKIPEVNDNSTFRAM